MHPHPTNQHRATRYGSWRDKADVTTFYFSRFPTWVNEKDLWQTFQRWGKVWEVFIPKYKNREGQRFGFVRYKDVHDVERLERKLDNNIFFGRTKMFVNQPKFQRSKEASQKQKTNVGNDNLRVEVRGSQGGSKVIANGGRIRSHAEVVKHLSPGKTKQCHQKPESSHLPHDVQRSMVLETSKLQSDWIRNAWVDTEVTPCYWGDDWVILHNLQDSKATQLIQEERTKGSSPFLDLQKWSQDIRPTYRLTWVILWGLPPLVWEQESMGKVLAEVGELVEVDEMDPRQDAEAAGDTDGNNGNRRWSSTRPSRG
ncbi:hypothetical protein GYH30_027831 [Glycine max]|uniref:RRM domain-containing protein n=1 Tax=Glycine max TaxID=3847 RepID=K7LJ31_SOYBN|nr:hypothetical protein GYH30_027831 [Glycine max]